MGTASPLETFYMLLHSTKNAKKIVTTSDSSKQESEITGIPFIIIFQKRSPIMTHVVHNIREKKSLRIVYCYSFSSRMVNKMVDFCY